MDTKPTPTPAPPPLLTWKAPERPPHNRSTKWYLTAVTITFGLATFAFLTQAWSFLLVLILLVIVYVILHWRGHPSHTVSIGERALTWDKSLIPWSQCTGYWMLQGPDYIELHIETTTPGHKHLVMQTGNVPYEQISTLLSQFTEPLHDRKENILDMFIRICKL